MSAVGDSTMDHACRDSLNKANSKYQTTRYAVIVLFSLFFIAVDNGVTFLVFLGHVYNKDTFKLVSTHKLQLLCEFEVKIEGRGYIRSEKGKKGSGSLFCLSPGITAAFLCFDKLF